MHLGTWVWPFKRISPLLKRRQVFLAEQVPMRRIKGALSNGKKSIICKDRELQHHLVHLRIAVSPHAENFLFMRIEHRENLFWRIFFGQIVSRAMIENIPKKKQALRAPLFDTAPTSFCSNRQSHEYQKQSSISSVFFPLSILFRHSAKGFLFCLAQLLDKSAYPAL